MFANPLLHHPLQILHQIIILAIDIAAFLAAGEEGFIGVEDEAAGDGVGGGADAGGFVVAGDLGFVGEDLSGLGVIGEVAADEDADVVEFEALCGVDAADLFEGGGVDGPDFIVGQVPFGLEAVGEFDVDGATAILDIPVVAVAGHHAGFVVDGILFPEGFPHFHGAVEDSEVVVQFVD